MKILRKIIDIQSYIDKVRHRAQVGFVPTMGALHEGHFALIRRSLKENDQTVVSIFVNPTQFGPKEDFKRYPRTFRKDRDYLEKMKVQILFAPSVNSMYPSFHTTNVMVSDLTQHLCGSPRSRGPQHFQGVATVVAKLFNLVRPYRAYFGMKDFQQLRVIERLNDNLNFGVRIVRCPTVREKDGLALSSRNSYLNQQERAVAPRLYRALQQGRKLLRSNSKVSLVSIKKKVTSLLRAIPHSRLDYLEMVDPVTLQEVRGQRQPVLIAAALHFKKARLIDNVLVS